MANQLSEYQINEVLNGVRDELRYMSDADRQIHARNENSFGEWVRNTVYNIAYKLGYYITLPIRLVGDFIRGLWNAIFD
jgi:hypothetical protein